MILSLDLAVGNLLTNVELGTGVEVDQYGRRLEAQHSGQPGWLDDTDPGGWRVHAGLDLLRSGVAQMRASGNSSCCCCWSMH
jgi:hypothetical protein